MSDNPNDKVIDLDKEFVKDNGEIVVLRQDYTVTEQFPTLHPDQSIKVKAADVYNVFREIGLSPKQTAYLCALIEACGVVHRAVQATGISRTTHYNWLKESEKYVQAYELARKYAAENLLAIATDRAAFGTPEPHFYKEDIVGFVTKYSDTLMALLLKGEFPEKYGTDRSIVTDEREKEILKRDPGREILTDARIKAMLDLADKAIAAGIEKKGSGSKSLIESIAEEDNE